MVWTDLAGQQTDPPLQQSQIATHADMAGLGAIAAVAVALLVVGIVVRLKLDRRRLAAWESEWLATGPRWTTRR